MRSWGSGRLCQLPKIGQQVNGRGRIQMLCNNLLRVGILKQSEKIYNMALANKYQIQVSYHLGLQGQFYSEKPQLISNLLSLAWAEADHHLAS